MRIGLSYDLKDTVAVDGNALEDALEEYDSLETVEIIEKALLAGGHLVVKLGGGRDFLNNILQENVDIVFNIAEGRGNYRSREAQIPAVLEMLGIPYSGSDPECLALLADSMANFRTSSATTAKPRPCSPARAASMAALRPRRFVCAAIPLIISTMAPISVLSPPRRCTICPELVTVSCSPCI